MVHRKLQDRLEIIQKTFDTSRLLNRDASNNHQIARYYRLNRLAYKLINSRQGFVHMGISRSDDFSEDDFFEHANIISHYIDRCNAKNVLELAAGKAATTNYLAKQHKNISFTGLDLPNSQLNIAMKHQNNLKLHEGDYHNLSLYTNNSFDIVYIIEALCHAKDKGTVIQEVSRVLKPGGYFIVFDGYTSRKRSDMSELEILASDLTYTSMMVTPESHYYGDLTKILISSNFEIEHEENLSQEVLPSMRRLEKKAIKFFKYPTLARLINKITHNEVTGNAVAAYLMPLTVEQGLHQYWLTVAIKNIQ